MTRRSTSSSSSKKPRSKACKSNSFAAARPSTRAVRYSSSSSSSCSSIAVGQPFLTAPQDLRRGADGVLLLAAAKRLDAQAEAGTEQRADAEDALQRRLAGRETIGDAEQRMLDELARGALDERGLHRLGAD